MSLWGMPTQEMLPEQMDGYVRSHNQECHTRHYPQMTNQEYSTTGNLKMKKTLGAQKKKNKF